jgi:hypothetical protein
MYFSAMEELKKRRRWMLVLEIAIYCAIAISIAILIII